MDHFAKLFGHFDLCSRTFQSDLVGCSKICHQRHLRSLTEQHYWRHSELPALLEKEYLKIKKRKFFMWVNNLPNVVISRNQALCIVSIVSDCVVYPNPKLNMYEKFRVRVNHKIIRWFQKVSFPFQISPTDLDGMYVHRQKIDITDQNILNF